MIECSLILKKTKQKHGSSGTQDSKCPIPIVSWWPYPHILVSSPIPHPAKLEINASKELSFFAFDVLVLGHDGIFGRQKQLHGLKSDPIPWNYMSVSKISRLLDELFGWSLPCQSECSNTPYVLHMIWIMAVLSCPLHRFLVQDLWSSNPFSRVLGQPRASAWFSRHIFFNTRSRFSPRGPMKFPWNPHEVPISPIKPPLSHH